MGTKIVNKMFVNKLAFPNVSRTSEKAKGLQNLHDESATRRGQGPLAQLSKCE